MDVQYIKLKRTVSSFLEIVNTAIKAGEPLLINNDTEGQYLLLGGMTDGFVTANTKVIKAIPKTHADNYVYTVADGGNLTLKDPNANGATIVLTNSTTGQAGKVLNKMTFSVDGDGTPAGLADFDGSQSGIKISYNTIGAAGNYNTQTSGDADNKVWFKQAGGNPDYSLRNKFWIDTSVNVTKYWDYTANNGNGAWVPVPVAYT